MIILRVEDIIAKIDSDSSSYDENEEEINLFSHIPKYINTVNSYLNISYRRDADYRDFKEKYLKDCQDDNECNYYQNNPSLPEISDFSFTRWLSGNSETVSKP